MSRAAQGRPGKNTHLFKSGQESGADLRAFGVEGDGDGSSEGFGSFASILDDSSVILVMVGSDLRLGLDKPRK